MFGIYHDITIQASISSIMQAVTIPDGFNQWWTLECYGRLLEGEVFNFKFSEDYDWYGYIDRYIPEKSIQFFITKADKDWENTIIKFEVISYSDHKYILRFEQDGWSEINEHFRRSSYCWAQYLSNLKKYLETGVVVPFGQRTDF